MIRDSLAFLRRNSSASCPMVGGGGKPWSGVCGRKQQSGRSVPRSPYLLTGDASGMGDVVLEAFSCSTGRSEITVNEEQATRGESGWFGRSMILSAAVSNVKTGRIPWVETVPTRRRLW